VAPEKASTGCFRNSDQIRQWIKETFTVSYSSSGVKELLKRIGISYHKVTGFLWKANPDKQKEFLKKYEEQKAASSRQGAVKTRRYFVDACHPVWGLDLVFSCWLLLGQRFLVGMGGGRKRLNILGAYCPDDQEYLDRRYTDKNLKMPPGGPLSSESVADFELWIREGASLPAESLAVEKKQASLWSLQKPRLPAFPAVRSEGWIRNDIDRFILSRLEARDLGPSPEAGTVRSIQLVSLSARVAMVVAVTTAMMLKNR
jgi:hypothetical protein